MSDEAFKKAQAKAQQLHSLSDALNTQIEKAEARLFDLKLGVAARVPFDKEGDRRFLAWGKTENRWRLLYEVDSTVSVKVEVLVQASRGVRLKAVKLLPALFQALLQSVDREVHAVEEAVGQVDDFIDELALHKANG